MKNISAAAVTKTGRRNNNQDNFMLAGSFAAPAHDTFARRYFGASDYPFFAAVCDGMGGESAGERASYIGCKTLAETANRLGADYFANKTAVVNGILRANDLLCETVQNDRTGRMGSTVVAVLIQGDRLFYTNLGDSRLYLLRNGELKQMTKDHTEGQMMVDAGVLTKEQLRTHASRNKLNRYLGIPRNEMRLECPVYQDVILLPGDRLLIVSDGVSGVLDELDMTAVLSGEISTDAKAQRLVDLAFQNGSRDNVTALVIEIEEAAAMPSVKRSMRDPSTAAKTQTRKNRRRLPAAAIIVIALLAAMIAALSIALLLVLSRQQKEKEQGSESPAPIATDAPQDEQIPIKTPGTDQTESAEPQETDGSSDSSETDKPLETDKPEDTDKPKDTDKPEDTDKPVEKP